MNFSRVSFFFLRNGRFIQEVPELFCDFFLFVAMFLWKSNISWNFQFWAPQVSVWWFGIIKNLIFLQSIGNAFHWGFCQFFNRKNFLFRAYFSGSCFGSSPYDKHFSSNPFDFEHLLVGLASRVRRKKPKIIS